MNKNSEMINNLRRDYERKREDYDKQARLYIDEHGNDSSDYLIYRLRMSSYCNGAIYALILLQRELEL